MAYATETDLLVGPIPLPAYVDKNVYLENTADEIDSYLSATYVTPVALPAPIEGEPDPYRVARLVLKRINAQLASGRIITAIAAGGEDSQVHAYGAYLISEALSGLRALQNKSIPLTGATVLDQTDSANATSISKVPIVNNGDSYSFVDSFYNVNGTLPVADTGSVIWPRGR